MKAPHKLTLPVLNVTFIIMSGPYLYRSVCNVSFDLVNRWAIVRFRMQLTVGSAPFRYGVMVMTCGLYICLYKISIY